MKSRINTVKNNNKRKNIFKDNKGGFTLIELLATIAILSLIITIVLSFSLGVIKSSKEKSYQTTVVNVENIANDYLTENKPKLLFIDNEDGLYEYQCVSVQNLIDSGYFDNDIKKSLVREDRNVSGDDMVYLLRDKKTKTIIKSKYVFYNEESEYKSLCAHSLNAKGTIKINVEPNGWSNSEKEIDIFYNLKNYLDVSKYKISYTYEFEDTSKENIESGNLNYTNNLSLTVDDIGTLYTEIKEVCSDDKNDCINGYRTIEYSSSMISTIDKDKPVITSNYTGDEVVKKTVSIPIIIKDKTSGINREKIELGKNINVYIGDTLIDNDSQEELAPSVLFNCVSCEMNSNEWKYDLIINNYNLRGNVKIEFLENVFYDQASNSNEKTVFDTGIEFNNTFVVSFDPNGGTPSSSKEVWYGEAIGTLPSVNYTGYTFLGWSSTKTTPGTACSSMVTSSTIVTEDTTYYACWKYNKINVQLHMNGGEFAGTTSSAIGYSGDYITNNGSMIVATYNYGTTNIDLADPDYSKYVNIKKTGYSPVSGAEWKKSDGTTFSDSGGVNSAKLCNASNGDCTVTLYVNWKINSYTVKYDANGGNTSSTKTLNYGESVLSNAPSVSYTGYTFLGWSSTKTTPGTACSSIITSSTKVTENTTYYACWKYNKIKVQYHMNGGEFAGTTSSAISYSGNYITNNGSTVVATYNYGTTNIDLADPDYSKYINIKKTGYSPVNGAEWKKSDGTTFSDSGGVNSAKLCNASNGDCTVTLYVNWKINSYTVKYDANGGKTSSTKTLNYDESVLNNAPSVSYTGYTFLGWSSTKTTPGTACSSTITSSTIVTGDTTYYACWKYNKIKVQYHMNGGEFAGTTSSAISYSGDYITNNGSTVVATYNYGTTNIDLADPDYSKYINIKKTGYSPVNGAEWKKSDGTTFSDSGGVNSAKLCNASNGDCTVTLYVNWKINSYTVKYDANGGKTSSTKTLNYGESVLSNAPSVSYTGYNFKGWSTSKTTPGNTCSSMVTSSTKVTGDVIYYACWEYNKINVQLHMNGGEFAGTTSSAISYSGYYITNNNSKVVATYNYGTTDIDLADPDYSEYVNIKKTGYSPVSGAEWKKSDGTTFSDSGGVNSAKLCDASSGDCTVTLYVNWKINSYTVKYDANGGNTSSTKTLNYGESVLSNSPSVSYTGYNFKGWSTTKKTPGTACSSTVTSSTKVTGDTTYYACWDGQEFNVNYNANSGTGTMSATKCKYNSSCTLSKNTFVKDGYYLVGWGNTSSATTASYVDEQTFTYDKLEDTNLYAIWDTKPLRVYYNANGGGATGSYTLVDGWVSKDGSTYFYQTYEAGDTTDLYNYNYTGYIYLYKNGHYNDPDAAWNTESDGSGTSFSQSTSYKYSTLVKYADDLGDYYRLNLYANWYATTYGYYCFQATTGINCRYGMSTDYSIKDSIYSGYTYDSKYIGYYNGYYWYYSKNKECYYAGGDNSRYEWVRYYGASSSCYSSSGSSSGSSSSSVTGSCYCCYSSPYRTCFLSSSMTGNTSTCAFWGTMTAAKCSSYSD